MRRQRGGLALVIVIVTMLSAALGSAASPAMALDPGGFRAWAGAQAAGFSLPGDLQLLWEASNPTLGITQTRYQQVVGGAHVLGGQLTVLRRGDQQIAVIGAHYPQLVPTNAVKLTPADARAAAERDVGPDGRWETQLKIDPAGGRYFYRVENQRQTARWFFWIDAEDGRQLNKYSAIETGTGIGVKGDEKTLETTQEGSSYLLRSPDNRQATYDAGHAQRQSFLPGTLFTDADDIWNTPGTGSPGHPAAVDAHYYANLTDDFYQQTFGRNSLDNQGMPMVSSVHYGRRYNNAFWNGSQVTYGDGDGRNFRAFSGSLEVVAHELTHGVTDFTSNLIYQDESGALNESISDVIGATVEFHAATNGLDGGLAADWTLGEDISLVADTAPGLRNIADPQEDADPDHYSERYTGSDDNGGVHSNSGISNHAYYLLVNGGKNAGCGPNLSGHFHTADCDVTVAGIGLAEAAQIFYAGFISLPENATLANARYATAATATSLYGEGSAQEVSTNQAWQAVGVTAVEPPPPPPPCTVTVTAVPFGSDHPYDSNFTCTWVYDNGAPGFQFHFSLLDVEEGFDYVDILDADGNVLESLTGSFRRGYTSVTIPTSVGQVRLRTDPSINKRGFTVDAIIQP